MVQKLVYRYSRAFQQHVVDDLEEGRFHSINQAKEHYGIRGDGTIQRWLNRYGRNRILPKVVRVEKPNEQDQIRQLKKQIHRLEQALGRTQADKVLNEAFLELACEELGQDVDAFKKKSISRRPSGPKKVRRKHSDIVPSCRDEPSELLQAT